MGHHENRAHRALDETIEMAAAVTVATQLTSAIDTLIVVTADHAHTMSYSGYPLRGNDILGMLKFKLSYETSNYRTHFMLHKYQN